MMRNWDVIEHFCLQARELFYDIAPHSNLLIEEEGIRNSALQDIHI